MTEMSTVGTPIMLQKYLLDLMPALQCLQIQKDEQIIAEIQKCQDEKVVF